MDISTNMFLIVASLVLFLYVVFVFTLFLPTIGFGIIPVIVVAVFAFFAITISVFYNNYDPDSFLNDYTGKDNLYLISLTVTSIVAFVIIVFVMWLIYSTYSTGKETPIEDISQETHGIETPFSGSKTY